MGNTISNRYRFLTWCIIFIRKRAPLSLKVFLTALAIIDDLGAIVIIALFYSGDLSIKYLSLMLAFLILLVINKFNIKKFLPYLIIGVFLWDFTHNSGIHNNCRCFISNDNTSSKKRRFFFINQN